MKIIPAIEVINVSANVGWVAVNNVVGCRVRNGFAEVLTLEGELFRLDELARPANLIRDLRDICLRKPLRLSKKWDIEAALSIESNHAIKTGTIEEEKIERRMCRIKSIPHEVVVVFAL